MLKVLPCGPGVPKGVISGLEKFEGSDPAAFVPKGFAIVNVDSRGAGDSDGKVHIMGWEKTPKFRTTALRFTREPVYDIVEEDFPLPRCRTDYRKSLFQPGEKLALEAPAEASSVSYDSEKYLDHAGFTIHFPKRHD